MKTLIFASLLIPCIASAQGAFEIIDSPPPPRAPSIYDYQAPAAQVVIVQPAQPQQGIFPNTQQQQVQRLMDQQIDLNNQRLIRNQQIQNDSVWTNYNKMPESR